MMSRQKELIAKVKFKALTIECDGKNLLIEGSGKRYDFYENLAYPEKP